jgi:O-antigen/teichoic acid export membrane protein
MLKILKSSVRDTAIYSIGTFSSKLAGFVLVPLYTNREYLSENDYGVLNLVEANLQIIISVFGLGLAYGFERWYWDKEKIQKRNSIFFTILFSTGCLAVVLILSAFPLAAPLSEILFQSVLYADVFKLMMINAGLEIVAQTPTSLIRLQEKPVLFTFANVTKLVVSITFTVIFITKLQLGLLGVYYAHIIGIAVYFILLAPLILKHLRLQFEWRELGGILRFRFPLLLPVIALNIFAFNDRFVLSNLAGMLETGIYSLGAKLTNTIKVFLITAIWLALTPTIYKMMNDPGNKRFYSKVMTYLGFTVIIFVMLFSFYSQELVMIFASEKIYYEAYKVIPILALGIYFSLLKDISMIGLNITKKTGSVAVSTILVALLNLGLNLLLIPYFGIIGAAVSSLFSQFIFFTIILLIAQKHYRIPYELRKIWLMIVIATSLYFISQSTHSLNLWVSAILKLALLCSFPFLLYLFGFYEPVELDRLKGFWNKWKNPFLWKRNFKTLEF